MQTCHDGVTTHTERLLKHVPADGMTTASEGSDPKPMLDPWLAALVCCMMPSSLTLEACWQLPRRVLYVSPCSNIVRYTH